METFVISLPFPISTTVFLFADIVRIIIIISRLIDMTDFVFGLKTMDNPKATYSDSKIQTTLRKFVDEKQEITPKPCLYLEALKKSRAWTGPAGSLF